MEKLKIMRKSKGLSSADMAGKLGLSRTYYWQIEKGTRGLSYNIAYKISEVFGTKPDDIFYDEFKNKED